MENVNDEDPMFEPRNPVVRVKKGAGQGFVVYVVQAFDPDGDGITFSAQSHSQLMTLACIAVFRRLIDRFSIQSITMIYIAPIIDVINVTEKINGCKCIFMGKITNVFNCE